MGGTGDRRGRLVAAALFIAHGTGRCRGSDLGRTRQRPSDINSVPMSWRSRREIPRTSWSAWPPLATFISGGEISTRPRPSARKPTFQPEESRHALLNHSHILRTGRFLEAKERIEQASKVGVIHIASLERRSQATLRLWKSITTRLTSADSTRHRPTSRLTSADSTRHRPTSSRRPPSCPHPQFGPLCESAWVRVLAFGGDARKPSAGPPHSSASSTHQRCDRPWSAACLAPLGRGLLEAGEIELARMLLGTLLVEYASPHQRADRPLLPSGSADGASAILSVVRRIPTCLGTGVRLISRQARGTKGPRPLSRSSDWLLKPDRGAERGSRFPSSATHPRYVSGFQSVSMRPRRRSDDRNASVQVRAPTAGPSGIDGIPPRYVAVDRG